LPTCRSTAMSPCRKGKEADERANTQWSLQLPRELWRYDTAELRIQSQAFLQFRPRIVRQVWGAGSKHDAEMYVGGGHFWRQHNRITQLCFGARQVVIQRQGSAQIAMGKCEAWPGPQRGVNFLNCT